MHEASPYRERRCKSTKKSGNGKEKTNKNVKKEKEKGKNAIKISYFRQADYWRLIILSQFSVNVRVPIMLPSAKMLTR